MRYFLIMPIFLLLLSGCSHNNAFSNFNMSKSQEMTQEAMLSSKIYKDDKAEGLISVMYLNKVFPKQYVNHEYFYISLYSKSKKAMLKFTLNGKKPFSIKVLQRDNKFRNLLSFNADWASYYLVEFNYEKMTTLLFQVHNTHFSSNKLKFEKSE